MTSGFGPRSAVLAFVTLATATLLQAQGDVDQAGPPPTSGYTYRPIAKLDGPLTFELATHRRRVAINLTTDRHQRTNLKITTTHTDSSYCLAFEPTWDPIPPAYLSFEIDGTSALLMFVYSGDTAAYRVSRATDSTGAARLAVRPVFKAGFIRYVSSGPDRRKKDGGRKE